MISDAQPTTAVRPIAEPGALRQVAAWLAARNLHLVIGGLLIFAVALAQNFSDIHSTQFHPDESRWLNRAPYLKELLHPFSPAWEDRYLTQGQPPGGSYITAIGLVVQGRDLDTNGPWNFNYGSESVTWWNTSRGNMPAWDDLVAARRTSSVLGALTALAIFLIVAEMTNVVGGLVAGLFIAIHPLSVYLSTLAVSDAAFTWLTAMATLAAMALARKPTWPRALLLGLVLGGGASTKLTPLFLAAGLGMIGVGLLLLPIVGRVPLVGRLVRWLPGYSSDQRSPLGWKLLSQPITTVFVFFITYPFLWPDPIGRTRALFEFRRAEMASQATIWPDTAVASRWEAFHRTWLELENRYSSTGKVLAKLAPDLSARISGHGFDLPIAVGGLLILAVLTLRRGIVSPNFLGVAVAGGQALLIIAGLRVDFDRYYLPIVFFCGIGIGVLSGSAWSLARAFLTRVFRRQPSTFRPTVSARAAIGH